MNILQKLAPLFILLALIGIGAAGYFGYKYQKAQKEIQNIKTDPTTIQKATQEQVKSLVAQVSKLIDLPSGEDPTIATITDISKLKDQPFFSKAKNGDKVLIYTNAKKAILYDPAANKIIDVAPVNIGSPSAQQAQARIILRNGTTTSGLGAKVEANIKKNFASANILTIENASRSDYDKTVVVSLNDNAKDAANALAKALNVSTGNLPSGENKPDADILIIIGKDLASQS